MFWRMIRGSLFRQKRKMLMIAFTIALGASLATAMLNVMLDVGDKVNQELKTYGANINVLPKEASLLDDLYGMEASEAAGKYLKEEELGNIKTIFWAFNIVDFAPYLETSATVSSSSGVQMDAAVTGTWFSHHLDLPTGESVDTGIANMKSWWTVEGEWVLPGEENAVMVGSVLAAALGIAPGDALTIFRGGENAEVTVKGVFDSGSDEDEVVYVPLALAQRLAGREGFVGSVEVSALTTPDNDLARRAAQNPKVLSAKDWETWYCTAYVSAISYQITEVITGSVAKPIRQVAESEGAILEKTQLLMVLITFLSLAGSALGIANLVTTSVMERSQEIGLLKALGAKDLSISLLILTEIVVTGIIGGVAGYFLGLGFAGIIGQTVFGSAIDIKTLVIPLVSVLVVLVVLVGSIPAIRLLLSLRPAEVLHGR